MKVIFNTYPMAFHTPGGGELQLLAYERHLAKHGVDVERFSLWNPRLTEADLVHFFSCIGGSSHFCAFVKQLGLPLVVSSSLWLTEETAGDFPIEEIRHQLGLADCIITNSNMESDSLARVLDLPREKFVAVPNAVDDAFFEPADGARFEREYAIQEPFVLCVANIEPRKNQLRLAEAVLKHTQLDLVLLGHVRDDQYWQQVRETGGDRLRYVGPVAHDSPLLISAYAACRVFALPSLFETPGLAALEAAAQGARLVLTSGGSTKEYFGQSARYVDPLSVEQIGTAIVEALAAPRSQLIPMNWTDATGQLAATYRNALNGSRISL